MKNSDEYIRDKLREPQGNEQLELILLTIRLGLKSVWHGRKWVIYLILALIPLFFGAVSSDPLFDADNVEDGYVGTFTGDFFLFLFAIGSLLISLTVSSDEINDHQIELYLVRPIRRESLWLARWVVVHIWIFLANSMVATAYFLYYHVVNPDGFMEGFFSNLDLYAGSLLLLVILTFIYGGLYLFVGFMGNRGFTLGVLVAIVESFFISLLFLEDSTGIPRTHYKNLVDAIFGTYYDYSEVPAGLTVFDSVLYIAVFGVVFLTGGAFYLTKKEFN